MNTKELYKILTDVRPGEELDIAGEEVSNIPELCEALKHLSDDEFALITEEGNIFLSWVLKNLGSTSLAHKIETCKSRQELITLLETEVENATKQIQNKPEVLNVKQDTTKKQEHNEEQVESIRKEITIKVDHLEKQIQELTTNPQNQFDNPDIGMLSYLENKVEILQQDIAQVLERLDTEKGLDTRAIEERIQKLEDKKSETSDTLLKAKFEQLKTEVDKEIETFQKNIKSHIAPETLQARIDSLKKHYNDTVEDIKTKLQKLENINIDDLENINIKIQDVHKFLEDSYKDVIKNSRDIKGVQQKVSKFSPAHIKKVESIISSFEKEFELHTKQIQDFEKGLQLQVKEGYKINSQKIEELKKTVKNVLELKKNVKEIQKTLSKIAQTQIETTQLLHTFNKEIDTKHEVFQNAITDVKNTVANQLKLFEKKIQKKKKNNTKDKEGLEKDILNIREDSTKSIHDITKHLNEHIEEIQEYMQTETQKIAEFQENINKDVKALEKTYHEKMNIAETAMHVVNESKHTISSLKKELENLKKTVDIHNKSQNTLIEAKYAELLENQHRDTTKINEEITNTEQELLKQIAQNKESLELLDANNKNTIEYLQEKIDAIEINLKNTEEAINETVNASQKELKKAINDTIKIQNTFKSVQDTSQKDSIAFRKVIQKDLDKKLSEYEKQIKKYHKDTQNIATLKDAIYTISNDIENIKQQSTIIQNDILDKYTLVQKDILKNKETIAKNFETIKTDLQNSKKEQNTINKENNTRVEAIAKELQHVNWNAIQSSIQAAIVTQDASTKTYVAENVTKIQSEIEKIIEENNKKHATHEKEVEAKLKTAIQDNVTLVENIKLEIEDSKNTTENELLEFKKFLDKYSTDTKEALKQNELQKESILKEIQKIQQNQK
ncbi:MAG: hypothetical protein ACMXYK_04945, partial [Candidatus Woesearchaeota archaeon]